jgi:hypothetical protein
LAIGYWLLAIGYWLLAEQHVEAWTAEFEGDSVDPLD